MGGSWVARTWAAAAYSGASFFAVATPGGVEFNKQVIVFGNLFIEVGVGEDEDTLIEFSLGVGDAEHSKSGGGKSN